MKSQHDHHHLRKKAAGAIDPEVFAVHTTRPGEIAGAVEIVFPDEHAARKYAQSRSTDHRITSASVTRYTFGQLGTRHPVTWYRNGHEQDIRGVRPDCRYYPTDHPCSTLMERRGPQVDPRSSGK
jgi:hypothetical protein